MELLSILRLAELTGKTRETVRRKLSGVPYEGGEKNGKVYPSTVALERIYIGGGDDDGEGYVSNAEAQRLLTIKRREEIDLDMEIKRKSRIPLEVCEDVNDRALTNIAGILKAGEGKLLTSETIGDMLAELRTLSAGIREWAGGNDE